MKSYQVMCNNCRTEYQNEWGSCPKCGGSLVVRYSTVMAAPQFPVVIPGSLSIKSRSDVGNTPLIPLPTLSQRLQLEIWAKCEYQNPTGSFKDRGTILELTKALELKKSGVVCASTGNMAASLAAYAAANGKTCVVVVPAATPESKLRQASVCGAQLKRINGTYDDCTAVAQRLARIQNLFLCGDYVLRREGQKTIGWELSPFNFEAFVVPVGNGTVGVAIAQGLAEAGQAKDSLSQVAVSSWPKPATSKTVTPLPQFIGVQANTANPIEAAWRLKTTIQPLSNTTTVASAINVGKPLDGSLTLSWMKKTQGLMTAVTDPQITQAQQLLATTEGLFVESAAASTLAGLITIKKQLKNKKIALILTGTGLKERT